MHTLQKGAGCSSSSSGGGAGREGPEEGRENTLRRQDAQCGLATSDNSTVGSHVKCHMSLVGLLFPNPASSHGRAATPLSSPPRLRRSSRCIVHVCVNRPECANECNSNAKCCCELLLQAASEWFGLQNTRCPSTLCRTRRCTSSDDQTFRPVLAPRFGT